MVLFGAYNTAKRFFDDDRLTAHFPGPGSYASKSVVEGTPVPRYAGKLVEDGVVRPDGSAILFRERDCWVRGVEGPKGLTSLSVGKNYFVSPAAYSTESGERATKQTAPAALVNTLESRYLSPSTRCLTPDHERAAKGVQSPGPGTYYPSFEAWDFAPPDEWNRVNKAQKAYRTSKTRTFNTKVSWGEPTMPRPPDPARAAETPTEEERAWLSKRRGSIRPSTAPRCMWVNGVSTRSGLQAWGDAATKTGPIHVGCRGDCSHPWDRPTPRRGPDSKRRGPVHSCEARATSPGFREVRYLNRDLTRQTTGTATDTPGPGQYNIRLPLQRGTSFAGPRPATACSKAVTVGAFEASAKLRVAKRAGEAEKGSVAGQRAWPSPPPARSQRFSAPLMGRESPGPAYNLPSDFDKKLVNKKTFHPPRCGGRKAKPLCRTKKPRNGGQNPIFGPANDPGRQGKIAGLPQARRVLSKLLAKSGGCTAAGRALGVPVNTSMGRGFLLGIRADSMAFVRLSWGVLYTAEVLTRGNTTSRSASVSFEDPNASNSESGDIEPDTNTVEAEERVEASTKEDEQGHKDACEIPRPAGEA